MDKLLLSVLCFILSFVFFSKKGTALIVGKKGTSEKEQNAYNTKALSKAMAIVLLIAAICFLAMYLIGIFVPKLLVASQSILGLILVVLGIGSIIYINKNPRFRS